MKLPTGIHTNWCRFRFAYSATMNIHADMPSLIQVSIAILAMMRR